MEPEVIEISPPWKLKAKALKRKEVAYHEIIDVDTDEDVVLIQGNKKVKGAISLGPSNAEQGSMHSAQQVDSNNNKGKDVSMMGGSHNSNSFIDLDDYAFEDDDYSMAQSQFNNMDIPTTSIKAADNFQMKNNSSTLHANNKNPSLTGSCSSMGKVVDNEDVLVKRYESFKKFDIVVDYSDHYYATKSLLISYPIVGDIKGRAQRLLPEFFNSPKNWAKNIQNEWRILEESLPDTIFVRAYESRMDLLRAVIIGAEGTPYHDGLFFFDVCFPNTYPNDPPHVHYHQKSHSCISINIPASGKVCLSLLNTCKWRDGLTENWVPGTSTMLQVLVSLQGLVFTANPYLNSEAYLDASSYLERIPKTHPLVAMLQKPVIEYNEVALIASLKYMVSTMEKPPKHFEDFVRGHFRKRARDILMACKAYTEGVHVGCVVRGGVQDLDEEASNNSWSDRYKPDLVATVNKLVAAFKQIGSKEADDFNCLLK